MAGSGHCETNNNDVYAILAYIGGGMLAIGPLYQTYKMYKKKQTKDVSMKWSINYIVGLILVSLFAVENQILPVLIGEALELLNMCILTIYKIYLEKKFFCFGCKPEPEVHEISLNEFKRTIVSDSVTLSLTNEDLDDILEKSNDEDDIFTLRFTLSELKDMVTKIESSKHINTNINFREIHSHPYESDKSDEIDGITIVDDSQ